MTDKAMTGVFLMVGFLVTAVAATWLWGAWALLISGLIILAVGLASVMLDIKRGEGKP